MFVQCTNMEILTMFVQCTNMEILTLELGAANLERNNHCWCCCHSHCQKTKVCTLNKCQVWVINDYFIMRETQHYFTVYFL